jgi:integrase
VTAKGAKSYIFESSLHGKTLRLTIGDVRTWTIGKAQAEATRLKTLTDQGIDPRQLAAEQRAKVEAADAEAKKRATLVSDAWAAYLAHQKDKMHRPHIERGKKWGTRHLLDHERLAQAGGEKRKRGAGLTKPGPLYPLLQLRIADINADTLKDWQRKEAEIRANNARQAFEMFRAFWRWCATRPEYAAVVNLQAVESKELRDEVPSRKSKKFDSMDGNHLPAWFAAVRRLSNPVVSAYLQALLLTGARREEMAGLRWQDVDFRWGSLWVKDKVAEEGRKIPLTPYLSGLLADLKRRNDTPPPKQRILHGKRIEDDLTHWKPSEWVFSSPTAKATGGRLTEPRLAHNRALSAAGLPPLTLHGLRRTFISLAEWVEMPTGIVAQIVGHKPSATAEKHYKERPLDLLRLWHAKYEAWILERADIDREQAQPELKLVTAA